MLVAEKKTFVYGNFGVATSNSGNRPRSNSGAEPPELPPGYSPYAVEILREFSASEFIGKVYELSPVLRWEFLSPETAKRTDWYETALRDPQAVKFEMQGSGRWSVQSVRTESDDSGRYVAVALSKK